MGDVAKYVHFDKILGWSEHCVRCKPFSTTLIFDGGQYLRSQIFMIRVKSHNWRLYAKFSPFISIFRTKCNLRVSPFCRKHWNSHGPNLIIKLWIELFLKCDFSSSEQQFQQINEKSKNTCSTPPVSYSFVVLNVL